MANWAWPHTPASYLARLRLADGPFAGEEPAFLPPDIAAPVQIVWSGWLPGEGFVAYLYEWHGETATDQGRTDALLFRYTGRRLVPEEIPPLIADDVEVWADGVDLIARSFDIPAEVMWPGV